MPRDILDAEHAGQAYLMVSMRMEICSEGTARRAIWKYYQFRRLVVLICLAFRLFGNGNRSLHSLSSQ